MDYQSFGGFMSWEQESPFERNEDTEDQCAFVRGDCLYLAENGGSCKPEHGGCPRECRHYEPLYAAAGRDEAVH